MAVEAMAATRGDESKAVEVMAETQGEESKEDFIVYNFERNVVEYNKIKVSFKSDYETLMSKVEVECKSPNPTFFVDNRQFGMGGLELGKGRYGFVQIYHTLQDSETVVKQISVQDPQDPQDPKKILQKEADLNLKLYGVGKLHYDSQSKIGYIRMKKLPPSLEKILTNRTITSNYFGNKGLAENLKLLLNILEEINRLHNNNVAHCDIHWGNICVSDEFKVSLCDFGRAQSPLQEQGIHNDNALINALLKSLSESMTIPHLLQQAAAMLSKHCKSKKADTSAPTVKEYIPTVEEYISSCASLIDAENSKQKEYDELKIQLNDKFQILETSIQKDLSSNSQINKFLKSIFAKMSKTTNQINRDPHMQIMKILLKLIKIIQQKNNENFNLTNFKQSLDSLKLLCTVHNPEGVEDIEMILTLLNSPKKYQSTSQDENLDKKAEFRDHQISGPNDTLSKSKPLSAKTENTLFQRFKDKWAGTSPWIKIPLAFLVTAGLIAIAATGIGAIIEVAIGVGGVTGSLLFAGVGSLIVAKGAATMVGAAVIVGGLGVAITGLFSAAMKFVTKKQIAKPASYEKQMDEAAAPKVEEHKQLDSPTSTRQSTIDKEYASSSPQIIKGLEIKPEEALAALSQPTKLGSTQSRRIQHIELQCKKLIDSVKAQDAKKVSTILKENPEIYANEDKQYSIHLQVFSADRTKDFSILKLVIDSTPKEELSGLLIEFGKQMITSQELIDYVEKLLKAPSQAVLSDAKPILLTSLTSSNGP